MQAADETVAIITTGGTIDKAYFDALSAYQVGEPMVRKVLEAARVSLPILVHELLRKDSLDLTDSDRTQLRTTVAALPQTRIVITHGTDTMPESALALRGIAGKAIVLTGALSPARFSDSDATFNLGMALAAVQILPAGVYIVMNGRVFQGEAVRKDRERNEFVALDGSPQPSR